MDFKAQIKKKIELGTLERMSPQRAKEELAGPHHCTYPGVVTSETSRLAREIMEDQKSEARGVVIESAPSGSGGAISRGNDVGKTPPPPTLMKGKGKPGTNNTAAKGKSAPPGKKLRAAEELAITWLRKKKG